MALPGAGSRGNTGAKRAFFPVGTGNLAPMTAVVQRQPDSSLHGLRTDIFQLDGTDTAEGMSRSDPQRRA